MSVRTVQEQGALTNRHFHTLIELKIDIVMVIEQRDYNSSKLVLSQYLTIRPKWPHVKPTSRATQTEYKYVEKGQDPSHYRHS
jgi:hypothetical protein